VITVHLDGYTGPDVADTVPVIVALLHEIDEPPVVIVMLPEVPVKDPPVLRQFAAVTGRAIIRNEPITALSVTRRTITLSMSASPYE
jgi:hypothetical protein